MLKEIGRIKQRKSSNQELRSLQYLGYHEKVEIVLSQKHFKDIRFAWSSEIILCYLKSYFKQNSVEKNVNIKQALFLSFS